MERGEEGEGKKRWRHGRKEGRIEDGGRRGEEMERGGKREIWREKRKGNEMERGENRWTWREESKGGEEEKESRGDGGEEKKGGEARRKGETEKCAMKGDGKEKCNNHRKTTKNEILFLLLLPSLSLPTHFSFSLSLLLPPFPNLSL